MGLGGKISINTPQGEKQIKIHKGMQPGIKVRLKGLGFAIPNSPLRGDLFAILNVKVPKEDELTPELEQSLIALKDLGY